MKQFYRFFPVLMFILLFTAVNAQEKFNVNDPGFQKTKYIMEGTPMVYKSDASGNLLPNDQYFNLLAQYNATFIVIRKLNLATAANGVAAGEYYLIEFLDWNISKSPFESEESHLKNLSKALKYNYQVPSASFSTFTGATSVTDKTDYVKNLIGSDAYFLIATSDIVQCARVYNPKPRWEPKIGTISYVARMRPKVGDVAGKWSTDLSLGLAAGVKRNIGKNWGISLLGGIAITKIMLDAKSTNDVVTSSIEKPALTPNINLLFSYKNFSLGAGIGLDWINDDSPESAAWIYNNKIFYGIAFGINIFSSSGEDTTQQQDQ